MICYIYNVIDIHIYNGYMDLGSAFRRLLFVCVRACESDHKGLKFASESAARVTAREANTSRNWRASGRAEA